MDEKIIRLGPTDESTVPKTHLLQNEDPDTCPTY